MPSTVVGLRDTGVNEMGKATVPWGLPSCIKVSCHFGYGDKSRMV